METDDAAAIVLRYLRASEARDLDSASSLLDPSSTLVFPGGRSYRTLQELWQASGKRYRSVRKRIGRTDTLELPTGETVVYVLGELEGVNLHDIPFSGIRFLDRFVVHEGKILLQEVWNDLAESDVLTRQE